MGKVVMVAFFLLGFVVFSFLKFAAKGVREAYRVANNEPEEMKLTAKAISCDDEASEVARMVAKALAFQKNLISDEYNILPEKARDKWSIGYIGGYSDAFFQRYGIGTDVNGFAAMAFVFMSVFGEEQGLSYFRKFMDLQQSDDDEVFDGMKIGGNEVFAWNEGSGVTPMGWYDYVFEGS